MTVLQIIGAVLVTVGVAGIVAHAIGAHLVRRRSDEADEAFLRDMIATVAATGATFPREHSQLLIVPHDDDTLCVTCTCGEFHEDGLATVPAAVLAHMRHAIEEGRKADAAKEAAS